MTVKVFDYELNLFEDMNEKTNNIVIKSRVGCGKTTQIRKLILQLLPLRIIVVSEEPYEYADLSDRIEIRTFEDFQIKDYENCVIIYDCNIESIFDYVNQISKDARMKNTVLITTWYNDSAVNPIIMNTKYVIYLNRERLVSGNTAFSCRVEENGNAMLN